MNNKEQVDKPIEKRKTSFLEIFGIITAIITLIGFAVTIWSILLNPKLPRKRLESVALAQISLVDIKDELRGKLKINYNDREVSNISKCSYMIRNSGNEPIRPVDFIIQPYYVLPKEMGILDIKIVEKNPENLFCEIDFSTNSDIASVNFNLLNPTDFVKIDFLFTGQMNMLPKLEGRIAGIKEITNLTRIESSVFQLKGKILLDRILASLLIIVMICIGIILAVKNLREVISDLDYQKMRRRELNTISNAKTTDDKIFLIQAGTVKIPLSMYNRSEDEVLQNASLLQNLFNDIKKRLEINISNSNRWILKDVFYSILGFCLLLVAFILTWMMWIT